jgi:gamma-glutamyltranspeptidase / glutathione hydrolase
MAVSFARFLALGSALLLAACGALEPRVGPAPPATADAAPTLPAAPEAASAWQAQAGWSGRRMAVASANPLASDVGFAVLRAGGNAVDAAVAVQMVLTLVEPQSSGIGGGAFLLHWDGQRVQAWDGRETAPRAVDERLFLQADGKPMPMAQAVVGGRAVGVPGVVRMLEAVHRAHGRLPWSQLFDPAIRWADEGFAVSHRLHTLLQTDTALRRDPLAARFYYGADGQALPVGHRLRNPALASVLRTLAMQGSAGLYDGPVAQDIVHRVRNHPSNPGQMALADLQTYAAKWREPLCTDWQQRWRVCGMPPPSSGHLAILQILGVLERLPNTRGAQAWIGTDGLPSAQALHHYTEAARLAYADRARYVADPDFVGPPAGRWTSLLDDAYLRQRAATIGPRSMGTAQPGEPEGSRQAWAPQAEQLETGTSHISIVDAQGQAVALTTSIEAAFGARILADGGTGLPGGFLLNNQLTDFSMLPTDTQGRPVANRVQPGKRPRSSMSPTLVFDRQTGELMLVAGSPGGAAIIHFTAKALMGTLDWGWDAQRVVDLPNFGSFNGPTVLEKGRFPVSTVSALQDRGHAVIEAEMTSGLQLLRRTGTGWQGAADPRREGSVRGE